MREPNSRSPIVWGVTDAPSGASTDLTADVLIDVTELARKSSVAWIEAAGRTWPVWYEWVDDSICVVGTVGSVGIEQPLPALADGDRATVLLRSKTDRQLAAAVPVTAEVIEPNSDRWGAVTSALKAGRLNAADSPNEIDRWAAECLVVRLIPDGKVTPAADLPIDRVRTRPHLS